MQSGSIQRKSKSQKSQEQSDDELKNIAGKLDNIPEIILAEDPDNYFLQNSNLNNNHS